MLLKHKGIVSWCKCVGQDSLTLVIGRLGCKFMTLRNLRQPRRGGQSVPWHLVPAERQGDEAHSQAARIQYTRRYF